MPPLDESVLAAVDKALTDVSEELGNLRTAGKSLGSASERLEEASGAIKGVGQSVISLADRLKDVTAAIGRLDPSALDGRLSELQAALKATKDELVRTNIESRNQMLQQAAKLDSTLNAARDRLTIHAAETKTGLGALEVAGQETAARVKELSALTSVGLAALTTQTKEEAELTRLAVDDAKGQLEAGARMESRRISEELAELRKSVLGDMAKSRVLLYVLLGLSTLAMIAAVSSFLIRR